MTVAAVAETADFAVALPLHPAALEVPRDVVKIDVINVVVFAILQVEYPLSDVVQSPPCLHWWELLRSECLLCSRNPTK